MAKVRALFKESGLSLVELGRRMGYAEETARQAAWQFMKSQDPRLSMLRKFAKALSISLDELTPKGKRMVRRLDTALEQYGCQLDPISFRELLEGRHEYMFPSWTIDELVCNPDDAKKYCHSIRAETECPELPDPLILRTLMNARRSHNSEG